MEQIPLNEETDKELSSLLASLSKKEQIGEENEIYVTLKEIENHQGKIENHLSIISGIMIFYLSVSILVGIIYFLYLFVE